MATRRDVLKGGAVALAAARLHAAQGLIFPSGSVANAPAQQYVGINALSDINYYSITQPFLNIFKQAGSNSKFSPWFTSVNGGTLDTSEEQWIQIDANGWPTSLTLGNGFSGTQVMNCVQAWMFKNIAAPSPLPTGTTESFPYIGVTYRMRGQGAGTFALAGASSLAVVSGSVTAGTDPTTGYPQVVSTETSGGTWELTFSIGSSGLAYITTALPSSTNYLKVLDIVDNSLAASYDAGEIFHPTFKAALTNSGSKGFQRIRFMDSVKTEAQSLTMLFSADLASGATSGTIATNGIGWGDPAGGRTTYSTWPLPSGTYQVIFATGQVIPVTLTAGSAAVTWSTPLSAAITTANIGTMAAIALHTWATRPLMTDATWSTWRGVPWEITALLCNELNMDWWGNIGTAPSIADSTYAANLAALLFNGAGAVVESPISSFPGLYSALKAYVESANEPWNYAGDYLDNHNTLSMMSYQMGFYAGRGNSEFYGSAEYYGTLVATISDAFAAAYGSQFSGRVTVVMGIQTGTGNGVGWAKDAMNTPDWTSAAYTHGIGAIAVTAYFGPDGMSSADIATLLATANPLNTLFALAWANVVGGTTYSSVNAAGYAGGPINTVAGFRTGTGYNGWNDEPWAAIDIEGYEGGIAFDVTLSSGDPSYATWVALCTSAMEDPRIAYLQYDPTHQLSANAGAIPMFAAAGVRFNHLSLASIYPSWSLLELVTQPISPLSSAPYPYQGVMEYIAA